jgi:triosephosphate isomerase
MRTPFIVGNWKMNLDRAGAEALASGVAAKTADIRNVNVGVAPPFPYLAGVKSALGSSSVMLASQNIYFEAKGAFTGEVSAAMALDVGCTLTLVGHSERRLILGEDDAFINKKVKAALAARLNVILCVGETLEQRQSQRTEAVVEKQLTGSLDGITLDPKFLVIAYEPVWAIGTGVVATPEQAEDVHRFVRQWLTMKFGGTVAEATVIQYGGSVNPGNAATLMAKPNVDGLLVGGASLKADDFSAIVAAAQR